jgi:signal peptidase
MFSIIWLPHFNLNDSRVFIEKTGSMFPAIKPGSVIFVQKTTSYKINDIITFQSDPISTTHRIYKIVNRNGKDYFVTKGDRNDALDNYLISHENIIGKVKYTMPYLGFLLTFLKTKLGLYLFIFLPTLSIIIIEVKKIFREFNK